MSICPYCSYSLLRHVRQGKIYWFCSHCWQEVPNFEALSSFIDRVIEPVDRRATKAPINS